MSYTPDINGGLYEKGSLYTRLSPAAQWAFAQHRIGLFNQSIQNVSSNW